MKKKPFFTWLLFTCLIYFPANVKAQCGIDFFIANDQSGSVDALENLQSRDFILQLGQAAPLGNANTQNRIAIADWSETGNFQQFNFPFANQNYTTAVIDVEAYREGLRVFSGGTDPYQALLQSYQLINQTSVPGRSVRKVILLMTDASCNQIQSGITQLATQIKAAGITVAVMAIGPAASCTILQGTNVASSGMYFSATDYAALFSNAATMATDVIAASCLQPLPTWDLTVNVNSVNCATGQVSYTINNIGFASFSNTLSVTFYNGDPTLPTTRLLATHSQASQTIAAGAAATYSFTSSAIIARANVWAVVNISTTGANATPAIPVDISTRLLISGEWNTTNNIGSGLATGCASVPVLETTNASGGITCLKRVTYNATVCNTGTLAASNVRVRDVPHHANFILESATINNNSGSGILTAPVRGFANFAHPGGDAAATGWDGFATTATGGTFNGTTYTFPNNGSPAGTAGLGFPPVSGNGIPAGSRIISATLTVRIFNALDGSVCTVRGHRSANSTAFTSASNPFARWTGASTTASTTYNVANDYDGLINVNVTAITQEIVNEAAWTNNSALTYLIRSDDEHEMGLRENATAGNRPVLVVEYESPASISSLEPGQCITVSFVYNASTVPAATYQNSIGVTTTTSSPVYLPNTNFTVLAQSGINGYNGATNTGDEITIPASTGCVQTAQPITTAVSIVPASSCRGNGNYVTATVTITNPNTAISIYNANQVLNLTGAGALFASEPYNITNGLQLAQPNVLSPAYPAVANALYGASGTESIQVYVIPPGTSTFNIDIDAGTATLNLASTITNIPVTYNSSGSSNTASDAGGVTISAAPTITWSCPSSVLVGDPIPFSAFVSGASGSPAVISATQGSVSHTYAVGAIAGSYTPNMNDNFNAFAHISISAVSAAGCDVLQQCAIPINVNPLSVNLTAFDIQVSGNCTAYLQWTSAQEQQSAYFVIEKSYDGVNWQEAKSIKAAGNSSVTVYYNTSVALGKEGDCYFRLKMTDQNGKYEYSKVKKVNCAIDKKVLIWPNPAKQTITIDNIPANTDKIEIINLNGQRIKFTPARNQATQVVDISFLPVGMYVVKLVNTKQGVISTQKFTRN